MQADGTAHYVTLPGGPVIGMWDDAEFITGTIRLDPGDTLLLFTDGLTRSRTPRRRRHPPLRRRRPEHPGCEIGSYHG